MGDEGKLYVSSDLIDIYREEVIPFADFTAWFDRNVIDGIVKQIESKSVIGSFEIRKFTTGSARDYILMATVGALCIFVLLMGVSS